MFSFLLNFINIFYPFVLPISIVLVDFPDLLHRTHPLSCFIIQQNRILVNKNLKFRKKNPIKQQKTYRTLEKLGFPLILYSVSCSAFASFGTFYSYRRTISSSVNAK